MNIKKIIIASLYAVISIALIIVLAIGTNFANFNGKALTLYFGELGGGIDFSKVVVDEYGNAVDEQGNIIDTEYFKINSEFFNADGTFKDNAFVAAQEELAERISGEGTVLLKNDTVGGKKALPLAKGSKVSVFGFTSTWWMTREYFGRDSRGSELYDSLANAGLNYNPTLARFYAESTHTKWGSNAFNLGNGAIIGNMALDEVPWSEHNPSALDLNNYKDAAIVVFSRISSEGGDAPRYMEKYNTAGGEQLTDDYHFLQLTPNEKSILSGVKAAGYTNTTVILHSGNPMELTEIDAAEYGVTACLWVAGTGNSGVKAIGKIIAGDITPSAHLVDTFSYDSFSAPAVQNFGDNRFTREGSVIDYSYINYGEGIYVGYKYYETRYEDIVLQRQNVGSYNYSNIVARPFGFGMSYTNFSWSGFNVSSPDSKGNVIITVRVTNEGDFKGKDVVQVYYQAPYTSGGIEKSSVELAGFVKTRELAAKSGSTRDSQEVKVAFNISDMASYDEKTDKTYVLDSGSYYITAATDAHVAVNNILAKKGHTKASTANRMTADGNADLVGIYTASDKKLLKESIGGLEVTNQFRDFTVLSDATYLSRANWVVMDSWSLTNLIGGVAYATATVVPSTKSLTTDLAGAINIHPVSETVYNGLIATGWDCAGNPKGINDYPELAFETDTEHSLIDMLYKDYDDPLWDELLAQMSVSTMSSIFCAAGYGTSVITAINKPLTLEMDGPQGLMAYGGSPIKRHGFRYPVQVVLGATWNLDLVEDFGSIYAQECLVAALDVSSIAGVDGLWAPGVNIHRTPFSGRNFEYFGECGTFTGLMAYTQSKVMGERGVKLQLKHFFLNEQETNRSAFGEVATFSTEQAIREIYLKAFQKSIDSGAAGGVMCSENRIGYRFSYSCYASLTNILRGEWGMKGAVITDYASLSEQKTVAALAGGCDMIDGSGSLSATSRATTGVQYTLKSALHNICYNSVKSLAMNGMVPGAVPVPGFPIYLVLLTVIWIFVGLYLLYGTYEVAIYCMGEKIKMSKKMKWIIRGIAIGIAVVAITTLCIMFFTLWFEDLAFALQMYVAH